MELALGVIIIGNMAREEEVNTIGSMEQGREADTKEHGTGAGRQTIIPVGRTLRATIQPDVESAFNHIMGKLACLIGPAPEVAISHLSKNDRHRFSQTGVGS